MNYQYGVHHLPSGLAVAAHLDLNPAKALVAYGPGLGVVEHRPKLSVPDPFVLTVPWPDRPYPYLEHCFSRCCHSQQDRTHSLSQKRGALEALPQATRGSPAVTTPVIKPLPVRAQVRNRSRPRGLSLGVRAGGPLFYAAAFLLPSALCFN